MANIGSTLRDTRIRNKIDITSVEQSTKIRAKYLRALENEEWAVLPGPTYVKSFLRTYAEFLGLDPYVLIEEYNARFEELEELELAAFTREAPLREQVSRFGPPSRSTIAIVVGVAFVGFLLFLGLTGGNKNSSDKVGASPASPRSVPKPANNRGQSKQGGKQSANTVSVKVAAKRDVWVCLIDGKGNRKIGGVVLGAGDTRGPYRSDRIKVTVGNGGADLRIDGKPRNVPETAKPLGYLITPRGVRSLPEAKQPTCGA